MQSSTCYLNKLVTISCEGKWLNVSVIVFTSSQATTVGPSHWAKGKPFLLASSNSSCLRAGTEDSQREQMIINTCTVYSQCHALLNSLTSSFLHTAFHKSPPVNSVVPVWVCVCSTMRDTQVQPVHKTFFFLFFFAKAIIWSFISGLPGDKDTTVATLRNTLIHNRLCSANLLRALIPMLTFSFYF